MTENKYLNEEKYQKAEKAITLFAILVLVIGLGIGGFLIYKGVAKPAASKVENLKAELESKKRELESKGVRYSAFTKFTDGEAYDLKIIIGALDPSFGHCSFDEYKNNSLTKEYCAAKNSIDDFNTEQLIIFGIFICIVTFMISGSIFAYAKKRHIVAFETQQVMPVAKEGINEMAPVVGNVATEIAKGIKKGLNDEEK